MRGRAGAQQRGKQRSAVFHVGAPALAPDFDSLQAGGGAAARGGEREAKLGGRDRRARCEAVPALRPRAEIEILQTGNGLPRIADLRIDGQDVRRRAVDLDGADLSRNIQHRDEMAAVISGVLARRVAVERGGRALGFEGLDFGRKARGSLVLNDERSELDVIRAECRRPSHGNHRAQPHRRYKTPQARTLRARRRGSGFHRSLPFAEQRVARPDPSRFSSGEGLYHKIFEKETEFK